MIDHLINSLISWLQLHCFSEFLSFITFVVCVISILFLLRFKEVGLTVYIVLAVVLANIQVIYLAKFYISGEPIALGTVLFTTTFLSSDILTEHFGVKSAKKAIYLGFWAQVFVSVTMILTLGHGESAQGKNNIEALKIIFTPSLRILIASLFAYGISQWLDIVIFDKIRNIMDGKKLWLRSQVSMICGGLIDTVIFSFIAWFLLSPNPVSLRGLLISYISSAQGLRIIQSLCSTPIMYLSYRVLRKGYF